MSRSKKIVCFENRAMGVQNSLKGVFFIGGHIMFIKSQLSRD